MGNWLLSSRSARIRWIAGLICCALLAVAGWSLIVRHERLPQIASSTDNPDPRLTYPTPYRNVHPDVQYVGDRACAACHDAQCGTYQHHPMGRALFTAAMAPPIEHFTMHSKNPFAIGGLHYSVHRDQGKMVHIEAAHLADGSPMVVRQETMAYAVGSGAKARSYLVNHDGHLVQSPITWYPEQQRWDLSPGYETRNFHFDRMISPQCLFCHANQVEHVPGTVNKYKGDIFKGLAIGCERCHGPGQLHVDERLRGPHQGAFDPTIVNPAKLEHSLREAICQQCHVQGEQRIVARGRGDFDFRPGLPLHLFLMDFVDGRRERDDFKFVSSVEQMMESRCYQASAASRQLGCTSCHDPHVQPTGAQKVGHYRQRCLQCHAERGCSVPVAQRQAQNKDDSCVACHMPARGSEVNHSAITDHRIPRRPASSSKGPPPRRTPGPHDLVPFHRHLLNTDDPEVSRNLGLAIIGMYDRGMPDAAEKQYAQAALPLLEAARRRDPHDLPVAVGLANALWSLGRHEETTELFDFILEREPDLEVARVAAGIHALATNSALRAKTNLLHAIRINPWRSHYHHHLAVAYFRLAEIPAAIAACRQASKLDIANPKPRSLLIQCFLASAQPQQAAEEYAVLRQLTPPERHASLASWYTEQLKQYGSR